MSGLFRSDLVSSGARKQIKHAFEHPIDTLRSALPSRGTAARRVARTAGVVALTTARSHPIVWGVALFAAVGLGWLYFKRQRQLDSEQDAHAFEAQQSEERAPSPANKRARKRATQGHDRRDASTDGADGHSNEGQADVEAGSTPRRTKRAGGSGQ